MTDSINQMFPNVKGYATQARAQKQLDDHVPSYVEGQALTVTVQKPDGTWLPVVVFTGRASWANVPALAAKRICTCGSL